MTHPRVRHASCSSTAHKKYSWDSGPVATTSRLASPAYYVEHRDPVLPERLHEKDLVIIDLDPGWTPRGHKDLYPWEASPDYGNPPRGRHLREPRLNAAPLERFETSLSRGGAVVCMIEGASDPPPGRSGTEGLRPFRGWAFDWLPGLSRRPAANPVTTVGVDADTSVRPTSEVEALPALAALLASHRDAIYKRTLANCTLLMVNDAGDANAGLVESMGAGRLLFLPFSPRKRAALTTLVNQGTSAARA